MAENIDERFKEIAARYCSVKAEDITNDMSFRDDLGLSSLDLMTFLGDLEDEFDVEFDFGEDEQKLSRVQTVGSALEMLKEYME
ncbi:MAG: phosphopantetheine-binding protein [Acutalibacteraceae bacterium]|nr:phosphopantetheine-binding protein [Acutalibacteraceae bacterium]